MRGWEGALRAASGPAGVSAGPTQRVSPAQAADHGGQQAAYICSVTLQRQCSSGDGSLVTMRAHRPVDPEVPGEPTATLPQVTLLVKRDEARRLIGVLDLPSAVHCAAQPRR